MITLEVEQGSQEWLDARLGLATASQFKDITAKTKAGGESSSRRNYRAQLILERLTGVGPDFYQNSAMQWGSETEDLARTSYMLATGNDVVQVGLLKHDTLLAAASPDGLIATDGGMEIKCKIPANHLESLKLNHMPLIHKAQVQGNLWITGREWWDYVSFDPRFPENAQLFVERQYRDEMYIGFLIEEIMRFLEEVDEDIDFIRGYGQRPTAQKRSDLSELFG